MRGELRTRVLEWTDGQVRMRSDHLAGEEPLAIRLGDRPLSVTMRTPGHDFELAAGFLFTEGVVQRREEIATLSYCVDGEGEQRWNVVTVRLRPGVSVDPSRLERAFLTNASCGVCGKTSIESVRVRGIRPPVAGMRLDPERLCQLPDALRAAQTLFGRTGGLHAAALFTADGELVALREDVGRHNAVDKLVGWALLAGRLPLAGHVLVVSGRAGFEIVQKSLVAGIPVLAAVSAPSSLAVELAREFDQTLIGFLRGRRFNVYAGEGRLGPLAPAAAGGARRDGPVA